MAGPYDYNAVNLEVSSITPSTVHNIDNATTVFWSQYLMERAQSVFKWTLPELWSINYWLWCLYHGGHVIVSRFDKFGLIPQYGIVYGYDVFYQPRYAVITNPLFDRTYTRKININAGLVYLKNNYCGINDLVTYYASKLALLSSSIDTNLINSKMAYAFSAKNKATAEAMKKLYDKIASGEPAVFYDKKLTGMDGEPWTVFFNNLKANFIGDDLELLFRKIMLEFDGLVGIPNSNTEKRERLIPEEVKSNNIGTQSLAIRWYDNIQKSMEKARKLFGIPESELYMEWQDWTEGGITSGGQGNNINFGAV